MDKKANAKNKEEFLLGQGWALFFLLLAYRVVLDISYVFFVGDIFKSKDYEVEWSFLSAFESYLLLFLAFFFLPKQQDRFSSVGLQVLFLIGFVPISSYYGFGEGDRVWFYTCGSFVLLLCFLTRLFSGTRFEQQPVRIRLPFSIRDLSVFLLLLPLVTVSLMFSYSGLFVNADLAKAYEIRETFSFVQSQVPFGGYFMNWAGKVAMPFLFLVAVFGYKRFRFDLMVLFSVLLVLLFSLSGHKSYFLIPVMAVGGGVLIHRGNFLRDLTFLLFSLVSFCILYTCFTNDPLPISLFVRRLLFVPAKLSWYYHDFFTGDFLYLSHSIFRGLFPYPFDTSASVLIAKTYLGEALSANNGVFSDGLKNFGIVGVYVWAFFMALLLKFCDLVSHRKHTVISWGILLVGVYTFINAALLTNLLTHGFFLILLLVYCFPRKSKTLGT